MLKWHYFSWATEVFINIVLSFENAEGKIDSHSSSIIARCWYRLMNKSKTCNLQSGVLSKSLTTNQMSIDLR